MSFLQVLPLLFCLQMVTMIESKRFHAHDCVQSKSCESHDFETHGIPHSEEKITLSFAVKLKNVEKLYDFVNEVSDPSSTNYGKHLTYDEVAKMTTDLQTSHEVQKHLRKYIQDKSQITSSKDGSFIRVKTDIETAEKILNTRYEIFRSNRTGELLSRTLSYELPTEVSEKIDYVFPTFQFPTTFGDRPVVTVSEQHADSKKRDTDDSESARIESRIPNSINPSILRSFYNISGIRVTNPRATQSVYATAGQSFLASDVTKFLKMANMPKDSVDSTIGINRGSECKTNADTCLEASLDVQYIMSVAPNAHTTFWSTPITNFLSWIEEVSSTINPPLVHSISYGQYEAIISADEQQRFSQEAARLAARGVSIVAASGDDGVSLFGARTSSFFCGFKVPFPANVPYVVSVGATMGPESGSSQEIACSSKQGSVITSGGGFSTIFERPSYQSAHVERYFNNPRSTPMNPLSTPIPYFPTDSMFNPNGRAIPDVSMAGNNYEIMIAGKSYQVSGTSASAPVFAAILTLANNERLNRGKSALGFVNPTLYSLASSQPNIFNDITVGENNCAAKPYLGATPVCCQHGFRCAPGWDPVTGLGSVNGGRLIEALANI